jgi:hypothetical protein
MAPIKVKKGMASNKSLASTPPKIRCGMACKKTRSKKPWLIAMAPKKSPAAIKENATGKPINIKTIRPANIRGGIHSKGIIVWASHKQ